MKLFILYFCHILDLKVNFKNSFVFPLFFDFEIFHFLVLAEMDFQKKFLFSNILPKSYQHQFFVFLFFLIYSKLQFLCHFLNLRCLMILKFLVQVFPIGPGQFHFRQKHHQWAHWLAQIRFFRHFCFLVHLLKYPT